MSIDQEINHLLLIHWKKVLFKKAMLTIIIKMKIFYSTWGYKNNETGEWNGMIGELINNSIDIGASPLFLTSDRIDVIDYLICTSQTRSKFVFRSPKLSFTENVFLLPFHQDVWICLIISPFIAAFCLYFSLFMEWKSNIGSKKPSLSTNTRTIFFIAHGMIPSIKY